MLDRVPPFWLSIGALSLVQGLLVALPGDGHELGRIPWIQRRHSRLWAAVPPLSVIVFVFVAQAAASASAQSLTYLALIAVPLLAALALGWLARGARPPFAALAAILFVLAWVDRGGLAGEAAALALSALSCVALGVLIAAVTPARWLAVGIVLMACSDATLVVAELLQHPNEVLTAAHPAAGLPRLQAAVFGSAAMGYGDLFVAAVLGGMLARGGNFASRGAANHADEGRARRAARALQLRAAALVAVFALVADLLFFVVDELPATVPVALALLALALVRRRSSDVVSRSRRRGAPAAEWE